jgi:hypothetical protein
MHTIRQSFSYLAAAILFLSTGPASPHAQEYSSTPQDLVEGGRKHGGAIVPSRKLRDSSCRGEQLVFRHERLENFCSLGPKENPSRSTKEMR